MFLKISSVAFHSLDEGELWSVCFDPIIKVYKEKMNNRISGGEEQIKLGFYKGLTGGQRALFMFLAFYNHANKSLSEFYWWSAYYYAQPKVWSEVRAGVQFFHADAMLQVLDEIKRVLEERNYAQSLEQFHVSQDDLHNDPELLALFNQLNNRFIDSSPATLKTIGKYIKNSPSDFIQFED